MWLLVSIIKPLMLSDDWGWLFIKERWICIMTYVKKSLIFKVSKVIYRFLYKDNNRKGIDE